VKLIDALTTLPEKVWNKMKTSTFLMFLWWSYSLLLTMTCLGCM